MSASSQSNSVSRAFSDEVDTGSSKKMRQYKKIRACCSRLYRFTLQLNMIFVLSMLFTLNRFTLQLNML